MLVQFPVTEPELKLLLVMAQLLRFVVGQVHVVINLQLNTCRTDPSSAAAARLLEKHLIQSGMMQFNWL